MKDRVAGAPGRYSATVSASDLQKLQSGEQFAITLRRDDRPIEEGTPYSKTAVLPDSLAQRLCPGIDDPTPADAFTAIANSGVVSQGKTEDGWTFRQWANGLAECWMTVVNPAGVQAPGRIYFPFLFKNDPSISATFDRHSVKNPNYVIPVFQNFGGNQYIDSNEGLTEFYDSFSYQVWGFKGEEDLSDIPDGFNMNLYVIGEWKDLVNTGGDYPVWEGGLY